MSRLNMLGRFAIGSSLALVLLWAADAPAAPAPLKPEEVVVLYNERVPEGKQLAEFYASKRTIPPQNVISVSTTPSADLARESYEGELLPQIQKKVKDAGLDQQLRCLVTVYGMPLRIGPVKPSEEMQEYLRHVDGRIKEAMSAACHIVTTLRGLGVEGQPPDEYVLEPHPELPPDRALAADFARLQRDAGLAFREADQRIKAIPAGQKRNAATTALLSCGVQMTGIKMLTTAKVSTGTSPSEMLTGETTKAALQRFNVIPSRLVSLSFQPATIDRSREIHTLTMMQNGLLGELGFLIAEREHWTGPRTLAALDSELSLLFWGSYAKGRWIDNPMFVGRGKHVTSQLKRYRTIMVSRLDGPNPETVRRMVEDALKTEGQSLKGKMYIDAQGLKVNEQGPKGVVDQQLRGLAEFVKTKTSIEVVLDNESTLFPENACPEAALYCGWYSVSKYVDSFQWAPGSVGYHIASFEAKDLRGQDSQAWCKRMIEEGICATLGPVAEPYLHSFPRADLFFPLLLTGKLTLVECYYRTSPCVSWNQVLLGDPLYNPFRDFPAVKVEDLPKLLFPPDNWGKWTSDAVIIRVK